MNSTLQAKRWRMIRVHRRLSTCASRNHVGASVHVTLRNRPLRERLDSPFEEHIAPTLFTVSAERCYNTMLAAAERRWGSGWGATVSLYAKNPHGPTTSALRVSPRRVIDRRATRKCGPACL